MLYLDNLSFSCFEFKCFVSLSIAIKHLQNNENHLIYWKNFYINFFPIIKKFLLTILSDTFLQLVTTSDLLFQNHYLSRTILYTSLLMHLLIQWPEINNTCNRIKKQNKYIMINNKITIGLHVHVQCTCTCSLERTEKKIIILNDHHIIIYHNDDIWSIIYHLKLYYNFL